MNVVYLLLGSNMADRSVLLKQACKELSSKIGPITRESSVYESEPWGFQADQPFLNQVVRMETDYNPSDLLDEIMKIELKLGRERDGSQRYTSRLIDIDILFFNDEIIFEDNLIIPHPGIPERMFTLLPLSELDGAFIHPGSLKSIGEMIRECSDKLKVYPYHPC
jgi:2-amino-4-hydroxy-6-hydroxymethyldihydropteridine diphosphokinase